MSVISQVTMGKAVPSPSPGLPVGKAGLRTVPAGALVWRWREMQEFAPRVIKSITIVRAINISVLSDSLGDVTEVKELRTSCSL